MADTTFLVNGFSIIGDPQINSTGAAFNTNTNASGGGELMVHSGSEVFESDDIIMYQVSNVDPDGTFTEDTVITGVIVYDNAYDYYNDIAKYTYTYTGTGDGVEIPNGRSGMGDRYLEFDADDLTSTDAGAPDLGNMLVVAGVDILGQLNSQTGPFEIPTNEDIDLNGDGIISPDEQADGTFTSDLEILTMICFAKGTLIETPQGPRFIETLREGDLVNTLDHGAQPIRWIGSRRVPGTGDHAPIRIKAGAMGNIRDLRVSPNHRMLVSGATADLLFGQSEVLVAAKHLINDDTIRPAPVEQVDYYHFLFDAHEIVFAEGCPSESLFPGKQSLLSVSDDARAEIITLFPELEHRDCAGDLSRYSLRRFEARALMRA